MLNNVCHFLMECFHHLLMEIANGRNAFHATLKSKPNFKSNEQTLTIINCLCRSTIPSAYIFLYGDVNIQAIGL